jgi:hypothetical protein
VTYLRRRSPLYPRRQASLRAQFLFPAAKQGFVDPLKPCRSRFKVHGYQRNRRIASYGYRYDYAARTLLAPRRRRISPAFARSREAFSGSGEEIGADANKLGRQIYATCARGATERRQRQSIRVQELLSLELIGYRNFGVHRRPPLHLALRFALTQRKAIKFCQEWLDLAHVLAHSYNRNRVSPVISMIDALG